MIMRLYSPLSLILTLVFLTAGCASITEEQAAQSNALCTEAKSLLADHKAYQAHEIYAKAVAINPDNARAWNGLGAAYDMEGKYAEAQDGYQHALRLMPGDVIAINNLGHLRNEAGDYEEAITLLEPHIHDDGANATMRQNLAEAYAVLGRLDDAEKLLHVDMTAQQIQDVMSSYKKKPMNRASFADLGSFPTEGTAQAHLDEAQKIAGTRGKAWAFAIVPEVKVIGGTPIYTVRITGESPQSICTLINAEALPCIPKGK